MQDMHGGIYDFKIGRTLISIFMFDLSNYKECEELRWYEKRSLFFVPPPLFFPLLLNPVPVFRGIFCGLTLIISC